MEGYDVCLLSNFYGFPQFNEKYGTRQPDGTYQISAAWQSGLSNGANVGEIIGLFINGYVSERFGYRYAMSLKFHRTGWTAAHSLQIHSYDLFDTDHRVHGYLFHGAVGGLDSGC